MKRFTKALEKTLEFEGHNKFSDVKEDRGGKTKFGISQRSYPDLNIKAVTYADAVKIYRRDYWEKLRCDEISNGRLAQQIFDTGVNMGIRTSVKIAQHTAYLPAKEIDGLMGGKTLLALNIAGIYSDIHDRFTLHRIRRYMDIVRKDRSQSKFLVGWIRRALSS